MNKIVLLLAMAFASAPAVAQTAVEDVVGVYIYNGGLSKGFGNSGSVLELKPDGTFKYSEQTNNTSDINAALTQGTWVIKGESIVMNSVADGNAVAKQLPPFTNETWELKGRKLTDYTPVDGSKKYVYERQAGTRMIANDPSKAGF